MISDIIKEKTSADHLLYVSLKYTKTCDVILNLIERWRSMIEISFDALLEKALKDKKIAIEARSPKEKIEFMRKIYKKEEDIQGIVPLYIFFKRVPEMEKTRIGDFRKNVTLKVIGETKTTDINLEQLKEYSEMLERFISKVKHILSK
jgi:hypothetical protein